MRLTKAQRATLRDNPTYRHALRFGMLEEKPAPVVFYFERCAASHDTGEKNER